MESYICPKCNTNSLNTSHDKKLGFEYFCHTCHLYFSVENLVKFWGWDVGDFYDLSPLPDAPTFEPVWNSWRERQNSYAVVDRMFFGIFDDEGCSNDGIDTGALHV